MNYLLFFVYLFLLYWLLTKIPFIRKTGIANKTIIILFSLRVLAGLVNGWLNLYQYEMSDSVAFNREGLVEYHLLISNPKEYFFNLFTSNYGNSFGAIFDITDSFWNNLKTNIIIKLLSLFNILSKGNYFINILFYNFLVFLDPYACIKSSFRFFLEKKHYC